MATRATHRLLVLEDLGASADYSSLYAGNRQAERAAVFDAAGQWLRQLHQLEDASTSDIGCQPLRELNHAHMFSIPLADPPAIELDAVCAGLGEASQRIRSNAKLHEEIDRLGETYLNPIAGQRVLLHGDFYPGSWLSTAAGLRVIDPEFCFQGPREFDLGIMAAHLIFCHASPQRETVEHIVAAYDCPVSVDLVCRFAGVELIRRLIGVAQLPLAADLEMRSRWLELGEDFVLGH